MDAEKPTEVNARLEAELIHARRMIVDAQALAAEFSRLRNLFIDGMDNDEPYSQEYKIYETAAAAFLRSVVESID